MLLLAATIRWLLTVVDLPLVERQFWTIATGMFTIVAFVWLLLVLITTVERYCQKWFSTAGR